MDVAGSSTWQAHARVRTRSASPQARTIAPVEDRDVVLGPLFTVGVVLVGLGLVRRSVAMATAGAAAIVVDQRFALGRKLANAFGSR